MTARDATLVCVLTPQGRGAVAVVAVDGESAVEAVDRYFQAANKRSLGEQPIGRIVYGHWDSTAGEDLVVCRRSTDQLEIHCHGGKQSSAQIVADLANADCEVVEPERWLDSHSECPIAAAAHLALTRATTARTAAILLDQYQGALRRELEAIVSVLEGGDASSANTRLNRLLKYADLGRHLTEPWQVVIAGQPNVGKSSLINALVGFERAIVFDEPGTTRDVVTATTAIDGWPVELSDTAGLHLTADAIETAGIALARQRLASADLIVWVLDATQLAATDEKSLWQVVEEQANVVEVIIDRAKTQVVVNKVDLAAITSEDDQPFVSTCAVQRHGIDELLAALSNRLVPEVPTKGAAIPFTLSHVDRMRAASCGKSTDEAIASIRHLLNAVNY